MPINEKAVFVFMSVLAIIGLGMIGDGINGMVISDPYTKELCSIWSECNSPEVCCFFYDKTEGVCNKASMCENIYNITKNEVNNQFLIINSINNKKTENFFKGEAFFGILLTTLSMIFFYYFLKHEIKRSRQQQGTKQIFK